MVIMISQVFSSVHLVEGFEADRVFILLLTSSIIFLLRLRILQEDSPVEEDKNGEEANRAIDIHRCHSAIKAAAMVRLYMGCHLVGRVHQSVIVGDRRPVSVLPVLLKMVNDSVRILVVLVMLLVMVFVGEEVMGTVGAMGEAVRRHMRERTSCEGILRVWVILHHLHQVRWERHAAHVEHRAAARTKEWTMATTMLHRPLRSSLHAHLHHLLHMLLDLFLHHVLDELWFEWAIALD